MYARDFLCVERRDADRQLNQFVEIVRNQFVLDVAEVTFYGMLCHRVVSSDDKGRAFQEEKQTHRFKCGNRGFRQTAVQIIDEDY
jgi:hypothetical protein